MRFAKSFLAAFALAVVALSGRTTIQATTAESSILWLDQDGYVEEIWLVYVDGELALI